MISDTSGADHEKALLAAAGEAAIPVSLLGEVVSAARTAGRRRARGVGTAALEGFIESLASSRRSS
jgi:hypothetical protein